MFQTEKKKYENGIFNNNSMTMEGKCSYLPASNWVITSVLDFSACSMYSSMSGLPLEVDDDAGGRVL